jgi:hypothetical protein
MKLPAFLGLAGALGVLFGLEFLLIVAAIVMNLLGLLLSLWLRLTGLQGLLAWLSVGLYAAFSFGALYFLLRPSRRG